MPPWSAVRLLAADPDGLCRHQAPDPSAFALGVLDPRVRSRA